MSLVCVTCGRGQEACEWCYALDRLDHETTCDCGLVDLGYHLLIDCKARKDHRWVIAEDYASSWERNP